MIKIICVARLCGQELSRPPSRWGLTSRWPSHRWTRHANCQQMPTKSWLRRKWRRSRGWRNTLRPEKTVRSTRCMKLTCERTRNSRHAKYNSFSPLHCFVVLKLLSPSALQLFLLSITFTMKLLGSDPQSINQSMFVQPQKCVPLVKSSFHHLFIWFNGCETVLDLLKSFILYWNLIRLMSAYYLFYLLVLPWIVYMKTYSLLLL